MEAMVWTVDKGIGYNMYVHVREEDGSIVWCNIYDIIFEIKLKRPP